MSIPVILKSSISILVIDFFYLITIGSHISKLVEKIQKLSFELNLVGVVVSYVCLILGFHYFVLSKKDRSIKDAFVYGVLTYGVFDGTNIAIFKQWSPWISAIDIIWGGILMSLVFKITSSRSLL